MLLIDIGNSRIKTGLLEGADIRLLPPFSWRGIAHARVWPDALEGLGPCADVVVANVAGSAVAADLSAWLRDQWSVSPRFVTVQRECAGVVTRYDRPEQLGVDRWLAVIAGYHRAGGAACVIDGGTALTIDVVDGQGQHIGGLIAPGLALMAESLNRATAQLPLDEMRTVNGFATRTCDAISLGCRLSLAGAIEQAAERARAVFAKTPAWYVTGGEAEAILALSPIELEPVPDLVLRGLAIVAERIG